MRRGIAFPEGWWDASLILVQKVQPESGGKNMLSFLTPFTFPVWAMIAVAIVATGIMYWMLESLNSRADEAKLENKPLATIFLSSLTFTGHFDFQPNTHAARILSFSWTFFSLVTVSAYTANLASFLVARRTPDFQIRTIQQAVRYNIPVCIHGSTSQGKLIPMLLFLVHPSSC
jgi:nitrate reductase NapE component